MTTCATSLNFVDTETGITTESYAAGSTLYFHKKAFTLGAFTSPTVNYLFAIDMATGKQKWNNNVLLSGLTGYAFSCLFAGGKGYSPFIQ